MNFECLQTLQNASAQELFALFSDAHISENAGKWCMRWLLSHRTLVAYNILCQLYGVDVFCTDFSCANSNTETPQWTYADSVWLSHRDFLSGTFSKYASEEEAFRQAVLNKQLESAFFSEQVSGPLDY